MKYYLIAGNHVAARLEASSMEEAKAEFKKTGLSGKVLFETGEEV